MRSVGFNVAILDINAERISDEAYKKLEKLNPRLFCFVVYGQNPNSGTVNMSGATNLSKLIKKKIIIQKYVLSVHMSQHYSRGVK